MESSSTTLETKEQDQDTDRARSENVTQFAGAFAGTVRLSSVLLSCTMLICRSPPQLPTTRNSSPNRPPSPCHGPRTVRRTRVACRSRSWELPRRLLCMKIRGLVKLQDAKVTYTVRDPALLIPSRVAKARSVN
jgi:hypothetical protein